MWVEFNDENTPKSYAFSQEFVIILPLYIPTSIKVRDASKAIKYHKHLITKNPKLSKAH